MYSHLSCETFSRCISGSVRLMSRIYHRDIQTHAEIVKSLPRTETWCVVGDE